NSLCPVLVRAIFCVTRQSTTAPSSLLTQRADQLVSGGFFSATRLAGSGASPSSAGVSGFSSGPGDVAWATVQPEALPPWLDTLAQTKPVAATTTAAAAPEIARRYSRFIVFCCTLRLDVIDTSLSG